MVTGRGTPEDLTCHLPGGCLAKEVFVWNDFWQVACGFSGVSVVFAIMLHARVLDDPYFGGRSCC